MKLALEIEIKTLQDLQRFYKLLAASGLLLDVSPRDMGLEAALAVSELTPKAAETPFCLVHNVPFRRFEKNGKVFYSHQTGEGVWCRPSKK